MTWSWGGYTKIEILEGVAFFTVLNILLLHYLRGYSFTDIATILTALLYGTIATLLWSFILKKDLFKRKAAPTVKGFLMAIVIGLALLVIIFLLIAAVAFVIINFH